MWSYRDTRRLIVRGQAVEGYAIGIGIERDSARTMLSRYSIEQFGCIVDGLRAIDGRS